MKPAESMKAAWRAEVVPSLRALDFRGSFPTWRRTNAIGDVQVVNVQSGQYNETGHGEFFLNLAVVPQPWLAWQRECYDKVSPFGSSATKQVHEYHGLLRFRVAPHGMRQPGTYVWNAHTPQMAIETARRMSVALHAHGLPRLDAYADRSRLLSWLQSLDPLEAPLELDPFISVDVARAVMLVDEREPSREQELAQVLEVLRQAGGPAGLRRVAVATVDWVLTRVGERHG